MIIPTLTSNDLLPVVPAALLAGGAIVLMLTEVFLAAANRTYQAMLAVLVSVTASFLAWRNAAEPARTAVAEAQETAVQQEKKGSAMSIRQDIAALVEKTPLVEVTMLEKGLQVGGAKEGVH